MNNAAPALLALVLVCALPAMTVVAAGPTTDTAVSQTEGSVSAPLETSSTADTVGQTQLQHLSVMIEIEDSTNRLTIGDEGQRLYTSPTPAFESTISIADDDLRTDHHRFAFEEQFADNPDQRAELIEAYHAIVRDRIQVLNEREQRAVTAHAAGEASDEELLRAFYRNYNEANELAAFLTELEIAAGQVSGYSLRDEARETRNKLDAHRSELRSELDGTREPARSGQFTVETNDVGYRVSAIAGDRYLQEVQRFDLREPDSEDQIGSLGDWDDYVDTLYPWALANADGASINRLADYQLYRADIAHPQGDLDAFVDGATEQVTREHQELFLSTLPREPTETWQEGDLEVRLNATPGFGPAELTVVDVESGEPVDATISVDGSEIGATGEDGTHWIAPPTGDYELTVDTPSETVSVTVDGVAEGT
ncbi:carboxypeptidase-like regulatory domain-containing protein [Natrialbaceae archaeon A-CW2]|uniref:carboxypeptidase-like regulatory domain-containing protein n=1 Tax=Natronosalvus amylolyticus TaxID=2961994 RepID=UPI0020C96BFF|nr:carboxypeptidase-like regulatory domain-containing protein [Natronosalvus amylolyticus]